MTRGRTDIKFLLIGDGSQKPILMHTAKERGLTNLVFHDNVPRCQLLRVLKGADIGMQILANVPAFYNGTSPNKFFDYLACGLPILMNYPGWLADLISRQNIGFVVAPRNPAAFADALEQAAAERTRLSEMGVRARAIAEDQFSRDVLSAQFVSWLEGAAR
jgi:glycosyltransferase involved in cell wall biosynthesis